mmetsp:Transcript_28814/g.89043  ORF Transcript_28814/g.89043 Transcript_28814/m.89043 type:complete len:239 (+) Transcript_28814:312-1028(+)
MPEFLEREPVPEVRAAVRQRRLEPVELRRGRRSHERPGVRGRHARVAVRVRRARVLHQPEPDARMTQEPDGRGGGDGEVRDRRDRVRSPVAAARQRSKHQKRRRRLQQPEARLFLVCVPVVLEAREERVRVRDGQRGRDGRGPGDAAGRRVAEALERRQRPRFLRARAPDVRPVDGLPLPEPEERVRVRVARRADVEVVALVAAREVVAEPGERRHRGRDERARRRQPARLRVRQLVI